MSEASLNPISQARVLVVEDEGEICELIVDMLAIAGFSAQCVQTDRGAYEALQHDQSFACMIIDVNLGPGTTGYDVARFARRISPELPVIYVSGQTSPDSFKVNSVPGSLFLAKPFSADTLLERVHMLAGDNDA